MSPTTTHPLSRTLRETTGLTPQELRVVTGAVATAAVLSALLKALHAVIRSLDRIGRP
jgi:alkylhydroperoxidase/carboxymuconolactone decarboxylase family protein YurZ